jgi:hypothetical protein
MKVFGKAADFYRLRVLKMTEDSELDLEWKEDILFRTPNVSPMTDRVWYVVQAVSIDREEPYLLKRFPSGEAAMRFKDSVEELLREVTKHEFENRFPSLSPEPAE